MTPTVPPPTQPSGGTQPQPTTPPAEGQPPQQPGTEGKPPPSGEAAPKTPAPQQGAQDGGLFTPSDTTLPGEQATGQDLLMQFIAEGIKQDAGVTRGGTEETLARHSSDERTQTAKATDRLQDQTTEHEGRTSRDRFEAGRRNDGDHSTGTRLAALESGKKGEVDKQTSREAALKRSAENFAQQRSGESSSAYARRLATQKAPGDQTAADRLFQRMVRENPGQRQALTRNQEGIKNLLHLRLRYQRLESQRARTQEGTELYKKLTEEMKKLEGEIEKQEAALKNKVPKEALKKENVKEEDLPEEEGLEGAGEEGEGAEETGRRERVVRTQGQEGEGQGEGEGAQGDQPGVPAQAAQQNIPYSVAVGDRVTIISTGGTGEDPRAETYLIGARGLACMEGGMAAYFSGNDGDAFRRVCRARYGDRHSQDPEEFVGLHASPQLSGRGTRIAHHPNVPGAIMERSPDGKGNIMLRDWQVLGAERIEGPGGQISYRIRGRTQNIVFNAEQYEALRRASMCRVGLISANRDRVLTPGARGYYSAGALC